MYNKRHTVHEFGTIVNNKNIKQVKNKKKLLGKFYAYKLGTILQFWLRLEHYYAYAKAG